MDLSDLLLLLPDQVLFLGAGLIILLDLAWGRGDRAEMRRRVLPYAAVGVLAAAALALIPALGQTTRAATMVVVDGYAVFFKVLAFGGLALVILSAAPYMRGRTPYGGEFYALLLVTGLAVSLAVSAVNLVLIYLGMELLSITSYALVGWLRHDRKSGEAALKAFLYGATASAVMLYGMSLLYGATGATDLAEMAAVLSGRPLDQLAWLTAPAIILLLAGFGFKAGLVPFHQWAPDAYEGAPTPITALLSTVSKATGFAILLRVFVVVFGRPAVALQWSTLLVGVSAVTMTLGNLTALRQTNVKRLLAYSSIAHAGAMVMGAAAALIEPHQAFAGTGAVLIYLAAYFVTNLGAFAVVIAIETGTGGVTTQDYAGLVHRSPWLASLFLLFLLSLAGIPPTAGFIAKFFVFGAAVQGQMWLLAAIAAVNSVVAAFYYLNIVRIMFLAPAGNGAEPVRVASSLKGVLAVAGLLTLLLGLLPGPLIAWATQSAQALLK